MASIREVPTVLRKIGPWRFIANLYTQMVEDNVLTWASALAYAWLFALFPFLIFLLTLIPYLPQETKSSAHSFIREGVHTLPEQAREIIERNIHDLLHRPRSGLLSLGLILTIWAASGGMSMTMSALDQCYDIHFHRLRPTWKQRPRAVLLTLVVVVMILLVIILLPIGGVVINSLYAWGQIPGSVVYAAIGLRYLLSLLLMFTLLAIVYRFGPSLKPRVRFFSPGALFSVVLWIALGWGFRYYIDALAASSYNKTYGAVGGVVVLLLLFYLDALVLLMGAEIDAEIDYEITGVRGIDPPLETAP